MKRNSFAAIMVSAVILLPACSFADSSVELAGRPVWRVGDIRSYQISRDGKKSVQTETVTKASEEGYTVIIEKSGGKKTTEIYSIDLELIKIFDSSGKSIDWYDTGIAKIKWPFKAGDSWSTTHMAMNSYMGMSILMTMDVAVSAEKISIDGKELQTLKVESKRRTPGGTYQDKLDRWYSRDMNCFVKSSLTRISGSGAKDYVKELVSFTPGPGTN